MSRRRRTIALAALALAVPYPAYSLTREGSEPAPEAPVELAVSAALQSCGVSGAQVLCKLDVSFNPIPGANLYTASVTSADGSVTDAGEVGPGSTLFVPYVGNGTYTVRVDAFGPPPEPAAEPELVESATAERVETDGEAVVKRSAGNAQANELEVEVGPRTAAAEPRRAGAGAEASAEANCEPAPELPPIPELTPEEQAEVDADRERVARGEASQLSPELAEKVAAIEKAEAAAAEAAAAPPCPAP